VFANQNNVLDPMDDDSDDDSVDESYADEGNGNDSDEDDDDWSQPSSEDKTNYRNNEPPDNVNNCFIDDDLDYPGDDETDDDFDADADDDSDIVAAPEEPGVDDDDATDLAPITEDQGVDDAMDDVDQDTRSAEDQGVGDAMDRDVVTTGGDADDRDIQYGWRTGRYNLRPRKEPSFAYLKTFSNAHANVGMILEDGESLATVQMSMKKGLKMFGDAGVEGVHNEMWQLHEQNVMKPLHAREPTPEECQEAMAYLMFLKRKWCGKVKGRGCANGRKQRRYINRADAASPTVVTEAVFLTAVINALENCEVAIIDIPGAFMQLDLDDETIHVHLTGKMVDLLLEIDRELYEPYLVHERGELTMYVELLKALYGTMHAAQLFWERLSKQLVDWGFT
jgi:hypothetical protein